MYGGNWMNSSVIYKEVKFLLNIFLNVDKYYVSTGGQGST